MKHSVWQFVVKFKNQRFMILGILFILILFRLCVIKGVILEPSRGIFIDSEQYLELARNLLDDGRYQSDQVPDLDMLRPPGYPVSLAVILGLTGNSLRAVILFQFFLVFVTAYLLYRLCSILGNEKAGLAASLLLLLSPNTLFWSATIMTESLFAFGLVLAFVLIVQGSKNNTSFWHVGLLMGLITLIRPIGLYMIILWAGWIFLYHVKKSGKIPAFRRAAIFLMAAMIILLPWLARNYNRHGDFTLSSVSSMTISSFHLALTIVDAERISWEDAKVRVALQESTWSSFFELATTYPSSFIKVQLKGIARVLIGTEIGTWSNLALGEAYSGSGILDALLRMDFGSLRQIFLEFGTIDQLPQMLLLFWGGFYSILVFVLSISAVCRLIKHADRDLVNVLLLALITVIYLVLSPGAAGEARFRVPIEPILAFLSGMIFVKSPSH